MEEKPEDDLSEHVGPYRMEAQRLVEQLYKESLQSIFADLRWASNGINDAARKMMEKREELVQADSLMAQDDLNIMVFLENLLAQYIDMINLLASASKISLSETLDPFRQMQERMKALIVKLKQQVEVEDQLLEAQQKLRQTNKKWQAARQRMLNTKKALDALQADRDEQNGNVRIICKIKPHLAKHKLLALKKTSPFEISSLTLKESISAPKISKQTDPQIRQKLQKYYPKEQVWNTHHFDYLLDADCCQEDVVNELNYLVSNTIAGEKSTIILIGQTGSGKTYTFMGMSQLWKQNVTHFDERMGIAQRLVFSVFQELKKKGKELKTQYQLFITVTQIFPKAKMEQEANSSNLNVNTGSRQKYFGAPFELKKRLYRIDSPEEGISILNKHQRQRRVFPTKKNPQASRSHIFLKLHYPYNSGGVVKEGSINILDMAGNQRGNQTPSMIETVFINQTTKCLRNKKDPNINFGTTYARIFQRRLVGAKIAVILALSSEEDDIQMTNDTITFAKEICH